MNVGPPDTYETLMLIWAPGTETVPPLPPCTMGKVLVAKVPTPVLAVPPGAIATDVPKTSPLSTLPLPGIVEVSPVTPAPFVVVVAMLPPMAVPSEARFSISDPAVTPSSC